MRLALIFLSLILFIFLIRLITNFEAERFLNLFSNPFAKREITTPLASKDPLRELEAQLREREISIAQGPTASDSAILVNLAKDDTLVLFSESRDLTVQVSSLQIILNKLTIEGRRVKKIDLRFDNPIIVQ